MVISPDGLKEVAKRSKGTPRIVNSNLWYIQQYAVNRSREFLYLPDIQGALDELGIDQLGLDDRDRFYLERLNSFGRPAGLRVLADSMSDTPDGLRDIEPYLVGCGLVELSSRGRQLTASGKQHVTGD